MHKVLLLMSDFLQKKSAYAAIYKDNDDEWLPPTLVTEGSVLLLSFMEDCRVGLAASSQRQFFVARRLYLVYRAWNSACFIISLYAICTTQYESEVKDNLP